MRQGANPCWSALGLFAFFVAEGNIRALASCVHASCSNAAPEPEPGASLLQLRLGSESLEESSAGLLEESETEPARMSTSAAQFSANTVQGTCDPGPGPPPVSRPDPSSFMQRSSLHDLVGPDGVLMISLKRDASRFEFSEKALGIAGLRPSKLFATDSHCASDGALDLGCVGQNDANAKWCQGLSKTGVGCGTKAEQAIADSHRQALLAAQVREHDWTLVLEDDAVLVRPERWNAAFRRAWEKVPPETQIVRLSWCMPGKEPEIVQPTYKDAGEFRLVSWNGYSTGYRAGGCTTAYMVHRQAVPEMLSLFPCCCSVDCCFENDLFNRVVGNSSQTRGMQIMMSMDSWGSSNYIQEHAEHTWGVQYGVMMQATSDLRSTRTG